MIKAVYFDLFFTLIDPQYSDQNEYDTLGISVSEWERYAKEEQLYLERALGKVTSEREIIDRIAAIMPYHITESQKQEILHSREERMKRALLSIDDQILTTLKEIHNRGIMLGLISNSDYIDCKYWDISPLSKVFDSAIFSCKVGILKPDIAIYQLALHKLGMKPEECLFVGDGGFDELYGAKYAGMKTVFTEYLEHKSTDRVDKLMLHTDYHINNFNELLNCLK